MRAKIIHLDLNPCGGAEHLALVTLKSLIEMGYQVDLAVAKTPDVARIAKSFGEGVYKIFDNIYTMALEPLSLVEDKYSGNIIVRHIDDKDFRDYHVTINTHADILPYFMPSLRHYVTYCHFPAAAVHIRNHDTNYLNTLQEMSVLDGVLEDDEEIWKGLMRYYFLMLRESLIITNSRFSKIAITKELQSSREDYKKIPTIIPPPVSVSEISKTIVSQQSRDDIILVLSRIHPSKKIENAVEMARILKKRSIGKGMIIAGNLTSDDLCQKYYASLMAMTENYRLSDYVTFLPSVHFRELRQLLQKAKAYFHPMQGEPFGISVVEAMAAGTIPIVPNIGGMTEFVPKEYHFTLIEEAADKIQAAMNAPDSERKRISAFAKAFSTEKYERQFKLFMNQNVLPQENSAPLRLVHKPF